MSFGPVRLLLGFFLSLLAISLLSELEGKGPLLAFADMHAVLWKRSSFSVNKP